MELPIIQKYNETFMSLISQDYEERIRILDIDGAYLISVFQIEKLTQKFIGSADIAFDSLWEAEEYLRQELDIELPGYEPERDYIEPEDWRDYVSE